MNPIKKVHHIKTLELVIQLPDLSATQQFASAIASIVRPGDVIGLKGAIGVGKTTFARAVIGALGGREEVPSPTFTLAQIYHLDHVTVWHFDLFRLKRPADIYELGIEDAMIDGISLIEWPEKMVSCNFPNHMEIEFAFGANETRKATLLAHDDWRIRLRKLDWSSDG